MLPFVDSDAMTRARRAGDRRIRASRRFGPLVNDLLGVFHVELWVTGSRWTRRRRPMLQRRQVPIQIISAVADRNATRPEPPPTVPSMRLFCRDPMRMCPSRSTSPARGRVGDPITCCEVFTRRTQREVSGSESR